MAVSIPAELVARAEKLAWQTGISRSQLFSAALCEYVARHAPEDVTEAMDRIADELVASEADFAVAVVRRLLIRSQW